MATKIKVPAFPESVSEGTIVSWHKKPGDPVSREEPLVDIETDKVMFEVPAPEAGVLQEILAQEGETVTSGQEIGVLAAAAASASAIKAPPAVAEEARQGAASGAGEPIVSPSAQRLLVEHGLDAGQVQGSGKGGRILKEDVLRHLEQRSAATQAPPPSAPPPPQAAASSPPPPPGERREERVPMSRLRARIAERLVEAQQSAAILTTFNEVNMQPVMTLRQRYRDSFEKAYGVRLGFMSFFVKASIDALRRFPLVNASVDGEDIVYHGYYDIGVAIGVPRGLVVPILRDADRLSMADIEQHIGDFATRAQDGKLTLEELSGGTFTITNGGVFGSLLSTPILNPPQSAILGMHKIQQRPVVEEGGIVIRPMMYLALSYDHRIIDGREAVQFLVTIKDMLEDPARMFIGI
ncbi:MAG: 2-oxoglutarate dehydrogenase complex dihydrolipoyllysine-residue succinyltransferase [Gammaproteobacteria bacterium]